VTGGSPYGSSARAYKAAAWSPLPLPAGKKKPPPAGWTGYDAKQPSWADVETWVGEHPDGNICAWLPPGMIGIDVDAHKGARELAAWRDLETRHGPLPDTAPWCSSRDDGVSGVRFFSVPAGYKAVTDLGLAGEVIQAHHRYVVVPPSIHPDTGRAYRWIIPAGIIPDARKLPPLPPAWLEGLRAGNGHAPAGDTGWTDPDIDALIEHGITEGKQDDQLRDVVWKLLGRGHSKLQVQAVWNAIAARTPQTKPQPWTAADFRRHWAGAERKHGPRLFVQPYAGSGPAGQPDSDGELYARRIVLTPASDIEIEPVVWAWEDDGHGRIPAGSLGLFAGREGTGKSSFMTWLTARITTGTLPGSLYGQPRGVIYVAVEDSWKFTIAPRLVAAGADLELVYRAEVQAVTGDTVSLSLPADNKLLEEAIREQNVAMVALDPLLSAISDTLDTHVNRQVRQALDPLARLADRTGAILAGVAHFNKSAGTDASSLITAPGAFKDVARFIFAFAADQDGSNVITQTKNSLGISSLPSLAYRIISAAVPTSKGDASVGRLVIDGPSERSVQDILSQQASGGDRDEKTRAEDYLKKALADGPKRSRETEEEAREVHDISPRTLKRARADMRIPARKLGTDWWISLPEHEGDLKDLKPSPAKSAKDAKAPSPGTVGTVGTLPRSGEDAGCLGAACQKPPRHGCSTCWDHAHLEASR
jgi:hypothetical protein